MSNPEFVGKDEAKVWDMSNVEFAGDVKPEGKKIREDLDKLKPIYAELVYAHDLIPKAKEFCRDFGVDALAKRYGIEAVMEAVARQAEVAQQESVDDDDTAKLGARAISAVYQELEPDPDKRRALYGEITNGNDAGEWEDGKFISERLQLGDDGEISVIESDESSQAHGSEAWSGMAAMHELGELITGSRVEGTYMFEDIEGSLGEVGDFGESVGDAAKVLTKGQERAGIDELVGTIEDRMGDGLGRLYLESNQIEQAVHDISEIIRKKNPEANEEEITRETEEYLASHGGDRFIVKDIHEYTNRIREMQRNWGIAL